MFHLAKHHVRTVQSLARRWGKPLWLMEQFSNINPCFCKNGPNCSVQTYVLLSSSVCLKTWHRRIGVVSHQPLGDDCIVERTLSDLSWTLNPSQAAFGWPSRRTQPSTTLTPLSICGWWVLFKQTPVSSDHFLFVRPCLVLVFGPLLLLVWPCCGFFYCVDVLLESL